ncbi:MAG: DUF1330 domain-containing protein [Phenylobacterium sp.]|uniref:DUF1330 domain-containing protein n=1 Tax=Phenylobacterium sp. TaxID=1871053 RepID=UPI0025DF8694|nr:DUF1330 domain-containing protein [Phenylobacterium sp.]MBA4013345.1 DUF1330 domain-containing protein [Phenylobacterium sp.]
MSAYAIAHLRNVVPGEPIAQYLHEIDSTLAPFGGKFRIHGGQAEVLEGDWSGDLIMIEFADRQSARAWYASPAYQQILPLRTGSSQGDVIFLDGVPDDHRATDVLEA